MVAHMEFFHDIPNVANKILCQRECAVVAIERAPCLCSLYLFTIQWMMRCARITTWIHRYTTLLSILLSFYNHVQPNVTLNILYAWISHNNLIWKMVGVRVEHKDWLYFNSLVIDKNILIISMIINRLLSSTDTLHRKNE